jgi:hypothetical protein
MAAEPATSSLMVTLRCGHTSRLRNWQRCSGIVAADAFIDKDGSVAWGKRAYWQEPNARPRKGHEGRAPRDGRRITDPKWPSRVPNSRPQRWTLECREGCGRNYPVKTETLVRLLRGAIAEDRTVIWLADEL